MANSPRADFGRFLKYLDSQPTSYNRAPRVAAAHDMFAEGYHPDEIVRVNNLYDDFLAYQMEGFEVGLDEGERPHPAPPAAARLHGKRVRGNQANRTRAQQNQRYQASLLKDRMKNELEKSYREFEELVSTYNQWQEQREQFVKTIQHALQRSQRYGNPDLLQRAEMQLAQIDAQGAELQAAVQHLENVITQKERQLRNWFRRNAGPGSR